MVPKVFEPLKFDCSSILIETGVENAAADYELEENIAVVTFGRENRIVQHLTNDYDNVREKIGKFTR